MISKDRRHDIYLKDDDLTPGRVGCLQWAYYSIRHMFGKGKDIFSSYFVFPADIRKKDAYYVLEGIFCLVAFIYAAISVLAGIFAIITKTDYFLDILAGTNLKGVYIVLLINSCLFLLTIISIFVGNRFWRYLLNHMFLLIFSCNLMPFMVNHSFLRVVILIIAGIVVFAVNITADYGVFANPKSGKSSAKRSSAPSYSRSSDTASRRDDQERYRNESKEEAGRIEDELKEDKKRELERELKKLNDELLRQQYRLEDLDKGYEAHRKGKIGYNVDPKVNREEYKKTQKEISRLKEQINAKKDEISGL